MSRAKRGSRKRLISPMVCGLVVVVALLQYGCKAKDKDTAQAHDHDMSGMSGTSEMTGTSEMSAPTIERPNPNVPKLEFQNQDGQPVHLSDLIGKPVLLSFIYTRCPMPEMCPLTTSNVAKVQSLLSPAERRRIALVSLTFDPEYDGADVLKEYGRSYHADFGNWQLWRGSAQDTKDLMDVYGAWATKSGDQFDHNMRSVILAPDGSFATELRGSAWDPEQAAERLRGLLAAEG